MQSEEVALGRGKLDELLRQGVIRKDDVAAAEKVFKGQRTAFGYTKFVRNVEVAASLYSKFGLELSKEAYRAALFYEASPQAIARLPQRAKEIVTAANALSRSREDPAEFANALVETNNIEGFLINSHALLLGLRRAREASPSSPLKTNPKLREAVKQAAELARNVHSNIASVMGLREHRAELGDYSFALLEPRKYKLVSRSLEKIERRLMPVYMDVEKIVRQHADKLGCGYVIKHRPRKQVHSAVEKMERKGLRDVSQLNDVLGMRVVLHTDNSEKVRELASRLDRDARLKIHDLDDYLGVKAKKTGYEAMHRTVGQLDKPKSKVDIQLQTEDMERRAEDPKALHAVYKGGKALPAEVVRAIQGIGRNALEALASPEEAQVVVHDERGKHIVRVAPGAPLLHAVAHAVEPEILAGGVTFIHERAGLGKNRKPSLFLSVKHGDTIYVARDKNGVSPSARWLEISRHPTIKAAFDIANKVRDKRRVK